MDSHRAKFEGDGVSTQEFKDRNLLIKCVNSLMGRQEISHQQVMSYLVGGGDFYASHNFKIIQLYKFISALDRYEKMQGNTTIRDGTEEDNDCEEHCKKGLLLTSPGEATIMSNVTDYQFCLCDMAFEKMSLWDIAGFTFKSVKRNDRSTCEGNDITGEDVGSPLEVERG
ncbi:hypothetical protein JVT61DRAFT_14139 [Boletus reticuloceps]|uniref:Uncharacterized protein n=1 Tax=Boletus reticuloceps TaxID=495285 RepID=A0A8I2YCZ8_9AGAM|nr:hypothetical protein JVT61DRAFT_14139 [Boletus reticuloceps]